jgi:hypothetical protein
VVTPPAATAVDFLVKMAIAWPPAVSLQQDQTAVQAVLYLEAAAV